MVQRAASEDAQFARFWLAALVSSVLPLFAFHPNACAKRSHEERKAAFVMQHQAAVSAVQRELDGLADGAPKEAKRDLELRLEQYDAMMDGYTDNVTLLDVLLWRQQPSGVLQAVIDVGGVGDG